MTSAYADYEWFLKKDLTEYSGKWIAVIGRKVVASGKEVSKVIKETQFRFPNKKPLVTKIRDKLSIL